MQDKLTIYIDGWCKICLNFEKKLKFIDSSNVIVIENIRESELLDEQKVRLMYGKTKNGIEYYGYDTLYQINKRLKVLWIFLPFTYLFKITGLGTYFYKELSLKRKIISLHCDENCLIK